MTLSWTSISTTPDLSDSSSLHWKELEMRQEVGSSGPQPFYHSQIPKISDHIRRKFAGASEARKPLPLGRAITTTTPTPNGREYWAYLEDNRPEFDSQRWLSSFCPFFARCSCRSCHSLEEAPGAFLEMADNGIKIEGPLPPPDHDRLSHLRL